MKKDEETAQENWITKIEGMRNAFEKDKTLLKSREGTNSSLNHSISNPIDITPITRQNTQDDTNMTNNEETQNHRNPKRNDERNYHAEEYWRNRNQETNKYQENTREPDPINRFNSPSKNYQRQNQPHRKKQPQNIQRNRYNLRSSTYLRSISQPST